MLRYLIASTPKAGTAMCMRIMEHLTGEVAAPISRGEIAEAEGDLQRLFEAKDTRLLVGHVRRLQVERIPEDVRVLALIRDPRDILVSYLDFLFRKNAPKGHVSAAEYLRPMSYRDRCFAMIDGFTTPHFVVPSIVDHCSGFFEWGQDGGVVVRYEDIVGPDGVAVLGEALGDDAPADALLAQAVESVVGKAGMNFNVGGSGRWRQKFDCDVARTLERNAWSLMLVQGYVCEVYDPDLHFTWLSRELSGS